MTPSTDNRIAIGFHRSNGRTSATIPAITRHATPTTRTGSNNSMRPQATQPGSSAAETLQAHALLGRSQPSSAPASAGSGRGRRRVTRAMHDFELMPGVVEVLPIQDRDRSSLHQDRGHFGLVGPVAHPDGDEN